MMTRSTLKYGILLGILTTTAAACESSTELGSRPDAGRQLMRSGEGTGSGGDDDAISYMERYDAGVDIWNEGCVKLHKSYDCTDYRVDSGDSCFGEVMLFEEVYQPGVCDAQTRLEKLFNCFVECEQLGYDEGKCSTSARYCGLVSADLNWWEDSARCVCLNDDGEWINPKPPPPSVELDCQQPDMEGEEMVVGCPAGPDGEVIEVVALCEGGEAIWDGCPEFELPPPLGVCASLEEGTSFEVTCPAGYEEEPATVTVVCEDGEAIWDGCPDRFAPLD